MNTVGSHSSEGSTPSASAPIPLNLGFTTVHLVISKNRYTVIDPQRSLNLLEVTKDGDMATIWVYSNGERIAVESYSYRTFRRMAFSELVLKYLESSLCEKCSNDWGPVCDACAEEAGDALFFLYHELRREQ